MLRSLFLQKLTVPDDVVHRGAQFVIKLMQVAMGEVFFLVEILTDQRPQLPSPGVDALEILGEGCGKLALLQEHFRVAEDVIDRCAEFMADARQIHSWWNRTSSVGRRTLAHDAGWRDTSASILPN